MHITLSLLLPRDAASISVVRHICATALEEISADAETVSDIEIAVTEACTNVVEHAGPGNDYGVEVTIDQAVCVIRIVDHGTGLGARLPAVDSPLDVTAEDGRGVRLMRALVDTVRFESRPEIGTVVRPQKRLTFDGASTSSAASSTPAL